MNKTYLTKKIISITLAVLVSGGVIFGAFMYQKADQKGVAQDPSVLPEGDWMNSLKVISSDATSTLINVQRGLMGIDTATSTTDRIGRDLLMEYAITQKARNGEPLSDEEVKILTTRLLQKTQTVHEDVYTLKDLNITTNSVSAIEKYSQGMADLTQNFYKNYTVNEAIFAAKALRDQDPSALDPLVWRIEHYKEFEKNLLSIKTPEKLSALHLELLNNYAFMRFSIEGMYALFSDPIRGLNALSQYSDALQKILVTAEKYKNLNINNI